MKTLSLFLVLLVAVSASADDRLPPPSGESLAEVLQLVKEVYGEDYVRAKTPKEKQAFAQFLFDKAAKSNQSDERYALLKVAKDVAFQCRDELAFKIIDKMNDIYAVDGLQLKYDVLEAYAERARQPNDRREIIERSVRLIDQALAEDNVPVALKLCKLASDEVRGVRDVQLSRDIKARSEEIEAIGRFYADFKKAEKTLQESPDDPEANFVYAKYQCFVKGNWEHQTKFALGMDAKIKGCVLADLQNPSGADSQVKIGDAWWKLAESHTGIMQRQIQNRAGYWYRKAHPALTGIESDRVKKRIEALPVDLKATSRINKIVIWNSHNSMHGNAGTKVADITLYANGRVVWEKRDITLPWDQKRDIPFEIGIPKIVADTVRITAKDWYGIPGSKQAGLAEIEVYCNGENVALGKEAKGTEPATSHFPAANVTDGITSSEREAVGYWQLPGETSGYVDIYLSKRK